MLELTLWILSAFILGFLLGYGMQFIKQLYSDVQYIITTLKEDILNLTVKCEQMLHSISQKKAN